MTDHIESFTREHRGITITVNWYRDDHMGPPWKEHGGHGPVSGWKSRDAKQPGERPLHEDSRSYRFYDWQEAMRIARRDGWGVCEETKAALREKLGREPTARQIAEASVQADFDYLKRWCENDWYWAYREVELTGMQYVRQFIMGDGKGGHRTFTDTGNDMLGGIDSDSIPQFTEEAFATAIEYIDRELTEREWAEGHEIVTEASC